MKSRFPTGMGWLPLCLTLTVTAVSCGGNKGSSNHSAASSQQEGQKDEKIQEQVQDQEQQEQQEQDDGIYRARLTTLNPSVSDTTGTVLIEIDGGKIYVHMDVNGAPAKIAHIQHIHTGTACPTPAADTNGDGFVDVVEGVPAYGPILVNLDGDLNSFAAGGTSFPMADEDGHYNYYEKASFANFMADLRMEDEDTTDAIVKLPADQNINLAARHVVVHGVSDSTNLPDSVQSLGTIPSEVTLPIACGALTRVSAEEESSLREMIRSKHPHSPMGSAEHGH